MKEGRFREDVILDIGIFFSEHGMLDWDCVFSEAFFQRFGK